MAWGPEGKLFGLHAKGNLFGTNKGTKAGDYALFTKSTIMNSAV